MTLYGLFVLPATAKLSIVKAFSTLPIALLQSYARAVFAPTRFGFSLSSSVLQSFQKFVPCVFLNPYALRVPESAYHSFFGSSAFL